MSSQSIDHDIVESVLFPDLSMFEEEAGDDTVPSEYQGLSPWAQKKIGTFQARLEAALQSHRTRAPEFRGIHSLSSALLIRMVNEAFGFNGWSSEIIECQTVSHDFDVVNSSYSMTQIATVRITLLDGTQVEATGRGEALRVPHKHQCLGNSKKMAITYGLRNAFLKFAEVFSASCPETEPKHMLA